MQTPKTNLRFKQSTVLLCKKKKNRSPKGLLLTIGMHYPNYSHKRRKNSYNRSIRKLINRLKRELMIAWNNMISWKWNWSRIATMQRMDLKRNYSPQGWPQVQSCSGSKSSWKKWQSSSSCNSHKHLAAFMLNWVTLKKNTRSIRSPLKANITSKT